MYGLQNREAYPQVYPMANAFQTGRKQYLSNDGMHTHRAE